MSYIDEMFWKNKLMAFLHDPPHKPYGIARHEDTIQSNLNIFGLSKEDYIGIDKFYADSFAAAADRFTFPSPRCRCKEGNKLRTDWLEEGLPFVHPFCGTQLKPHEFPVTKDVTADWMSKALTGVVVDPVPSKSNFLKMWRLWEKRLVADGRGAKAYFQYLVADTRIPDHTIWQHNALVSAMQSCGKNPAFLLFQVGPVQSFIAQAKTTRDLWAGSYVLSYLVAKAMMVIVEEYGPDHIISPQLKGNPMIDQNLWSLFEEGLNFTDEARQKWQKKQLLIPSLPNRFLALVPADTKIESGLRKTVAETWQNIAASVKEFLEKEIKKDEALSTFDDWDCLWDEQTKSFPRVDALIKPFESNEKILKAFESGFPPSGNHSNHSVIQSLNWATKDIYKAGDNSHKYYDSRNYKNKYLKAEKRGVLIDQSGEDLSSEKEAVVDNIGATWALQYMKTEWLFGALRAARSFDQRFACNKQELHTKKRHIEKDALDGVNEVLGGKNSKDFWETLSQNKILCKHFKSKQRYGTLSVIKRLFDLAYLNKEYGFKEDYRYPVKSTHEIASGRRGVGDYDELESGDCKYYAVIALDGDGMGEWLSGKRAQPVREQLSGDGIKEFFKDNCSNHEMLRNVSPSYHATFSEALANFSNYCAEPIISKFGGQLIYAGGDDVLAMVPAKDAVACSEALQLAFRGVKPQNNDNKVFKVMNDIFDYEWSEMNSENHVAGFLKLKSPGSARPKSIMLLPGPKATVSAGIAIGHVKSPMQDLIQAAREAEHTAKESGKDGFCLTIKKRSGETNGFFGHWNHLGEDSKWFSTDCENRSNLHLIWEELQTSSKFSDSSIRMPYIYCQFIAPLLRNIKGGYEDRFDATLAKACKEFLRIVLERQTKLGRAEAEKEAERVIDKFKLDKLAPKDFLNFWMCYAFMNRIAKGDE